MITAKTLSLHDIARIGVYLDDPYGDGIRLEKIRNPSDGRVAALCEIRGEPMLDGEDLIRAEYESTVREVLHRFNGKLPESFRRNLPN
jgi:hypothetical protein